MPEFDEIVLTYHASQRLKSRKITRQDLDLVLRIGEPWLDEDEHWVFELGNLRVIVREERSRGIVITAMKLRGQKQ